MASFEKCDIGLLRGFVDSRGGTQARTVVLSPVGDQEQLSTFVKHVKKLGISAEVDFLFVCKDGIAANAQGLSALFCFEKFPLGTSGSFFAGQHLACCLGYSEVVIADLDAFLDSNETFQKLLEIARDGRAGVPLSRKSAQDAPLDYFVINQWAAVPRQVFEECGFCAPYTFSGGEDYEFSRRIAKAGKLEICRGGHCLHPREGIGALSKMAQKKKFYPYLSGLLRAYLLAGSYDAACSLRYVAWRSYYSFFADAFGDKDLMGAVGEAHFFLPSKPSEGRPLVERRETGVGASRGPLQELLAIPSFIISGKATVGGDEFSLRMPRSALALGVFKAILLCPFRLLQSASALVARNNRVPSGLFPPTLENAGEVALFFKKRKLEGG